jgi:hypothetical protein
VQKISSLACHAIEGGGNSMRWSLIGILLVIWSSAFEGDIQTLASSLSASGCHAARRLLH